MHVSGNDLKCSAQDPQFYLVPFLNYPPLIDFIQNFLSGASLCYHMFEWLHTLYACFWQWFKVQCTRTVTLSCFVFNWFPFDWFYRAFLVRRITLLPYVQMTPNLLCLFLAMAQSAMHKNRNSTLFRFWIIPLWLIFIENFLSGA